MSGNSDGGGGRGEAPLINLEETEEIILDGEPEEYGMEEGHQEKGFKPKAALVRTPPKEDEEADGSRAADKRQREETPTKGEDEERLKRGKPETGEEQEKAKDDEEERMRRLVVEQAAAQETRRREKEDFDRKVAAEQERVRQVKQRQEEKRQQEMSAKKGEELTEKIRNEVKRINRAVTREVAGKISFRREDQLTVMEGTRNILDMVIELIHRLKDVEAGPRKGEDATMAAFNADLAKMLTVNNDLLIDLTEEMGRQREEIKQGEKKTRELMEQRLEELQRKIESGKQQRQDREGIIIGKKGRVKAAGGAKGAAGGHISETDEIRTTTDIGQSDSHTADDSDTEEHDRQRQGQRRNKRHRQQTARTNRQETTTYAQKTKTWKTPENKPAMETFIRIKDCTDAGTVIKELAKVKAAELGGPPLRVNKLKSGAVVMNWKDAAHRDQAMKRVGEIENIEVRNAKVTWPMFVITGVSSEYDGEEIIKGILEQNEDLREIHGDKKDDVKIITKRTCRNPWKNNWIFQAKPDIFKAIVKKGKVNFNLEVLYAEEYFGLALCFKCHRFGHVAKYCKEEAACGKCAGAHDTKDCQSRETECVNCRRMNRAERNHSPRDIGCPVYKLKLEQAKKKTVYGC